MIHSYTYCNKKIGEIGRVEEVKEFLVKASGLPKASVGEGVTFETGEHGRVQVLEKDAVEILVLSRSPLKPQTKVARTGTPLTISLGDGVLGHTINTLGYSLTNRRFHIQNPKKRVIELSPIGIPGRKKISAFFETGISIVDLVTSLGCGQRELIIGDRKTGKTHFLLQTVLSQIVKGSICIWASLGKRKTEIKGIEEFLESQKVLSNCVIVAADSHASPGEIFLAPYTAMTIAEYFRDLGKNVFIVLDDLTTHAKYYREISLMAGKFPGRESYPGDIFHIHSKLLERAGCFKIEQKEASITCLPVAESIGGDITGFIQTNLMSMTDGHLYFDSEIFFEGERPAINIFLSVTRVGRQTQTPLLRDLGREILLTMKKYEQAKRFLRFGPEISEQIKQVLKVSEALKNFFNQIGFFTVPLALSEVCIGLIFLNLWNGKRADELVKKYHEDKKFTTLVDKCTGKAQNLEELNKMIKKEFLKYKFLSCHSGDQPV